MNQYPTYKNSGVDWLDKIPSHWQISMMKRLFSFGKGLPITKSDLVEDGQPVISYGQIHSKCNNGTSVKRDLLRYVPFSLIKGNESSAVNVGDFIFADTSEDLDGCGNCVYIDVDGIYAGYHSIIVNGQGRDNKYFAYLFLTDAWRSQLRSMVGGVKVFSITQAVLSGITILLPPIHEQKKIVAYLDQKISAINKLIVEKESLIEDINDYRKSLITEAVTIGIKPNAPMKRSGIPWIKEIPTNWNIAPLKRYLSEPMKYGANESAESTNRMWPRYIRITDITSTGELRDDTFKSLSPKKAEDYLLEKGDILFARSGATVGKTYMYDGSFPACFAGYLIRARCNKELLPEFLSLYTYSLPYENWKNQIFVQATIQNIGADKYCMMPIIVPPIHEQKEICELMRLKIKQISELVSHITSEIEDLKRYKASIITEVVTGKIDLNN